MKIDVLILAGARNTGELKEFSKVYQEALIKISGIPMLEYVLQAVNQAKHTARKVVVGPEKELAPAIRADVDVFLESSDSMQENVIKGLNFLRDSDYVLIVTSDIPMVTAEILDNYIVTCLENTDADLYYPIIPEKDNEKKFPESNRTYFHLKEGTFTGGNIVLIRPKIINDSLDLLKEVLDCRKKPWKLCKILGMSFIFKFVSRSLAINDIEEKVEKITGIKGRFMVNPHPEIGFDVDKISDLEIVIDKFIEISRKK